MPLDNINVPGSQDALASGAVKTKVIDTDVLEALRETNKYLHALVLILNEMADTDIMKQEELNLR